MAKRSINDELSALVGLNDSDSNSLNQDSSNDCAPTSSSAFGEIDFSNDSPPSILRSEENSNQAGNEIDFCSALDGFDEAELERQRRIQRTLHNLQFSNPGEQMQGLFKSTGQRHGRRNRQIAPSSASAPPTGPVNQNVPYHDSKGRLMVPGKSAIVICDCLRQGCPGCHSPCPKCGGRLCGPLCQKNRSYVVEQIQETGRKESIMNYYVNGYV